MYKIKIFMSLKINKYNGFKKTFPKSQLFLDIAFDQYDCCASLLKYLSYFICPTFINVIELKRIFTTKMRA